jgi:hypothetical protein
MTGERARNETAQQAPPAGLDLSGFPSGGSPADPVFRAHDVSFGPWFFASHDRGRFNLSEPNGTCYFAPEIETAVREFYGPFIVDSNAITVAAASRLQVSVIQPPPELTSAHLSGRGAARFHVTSELTTMGDYGVTRAWAERFNEYVDALRYDARFDPGAETWALFGRAGAAPTLGSDASLTVDGVSAAEASGLSVLPPPPRKASLRIIPDPPG